MDVLHAEMRVVLLLLLLQVPWASVHFEALAEVIAVEEDRPAPLWMADSCTVPNNRNGHWPGRFGNINPEFQESHTGLTNQLDCRINVSLPAVSRHEGMWRIGDPSLEVRTEPPGTSACVYIAARGDTIHGHGVCTESKGLFWPIRGGIVDHGFRGDMMIQVFCHGARTEALTSTHEFHTELKAPGEGAPHRWVRGPRAPARSSQGGRIAVDAIVLGSRGVSVRLEETLRSLLDGAVPMHLQHVWVVEAAAVERYADSKRVTFLRPSNQTLREAAVEVLEQSNATHILLLTPGFSFDAKASSLPTIDLEKVAAELERLAPWGSVQLGLHHNMPVFDILTEKFGSDFVVHDDNINDDDGCQGEDNEHRLGYVVVDTSVASSVICTRDEHLIPRDETTANPFSYWAIHNAYGMLVNRASLDAWKVGGDWDNPEELTQEWHNTGAYKLSIYHLIPAYIGAAPSGTGRVLQKPLFSDSLHDLEEDGMSSFWELCQQLKCSATIHVGTSEHSFSPLAWRTKRPREVIARRALAPVPSSSVQGKKARGVHVTRSANKYVSGGDASTSLRDMRHAARFSKLDFVQSHNGGRLSAKAGDAVDPKFSINTENEKWNVALRAGWDAQTRGIQVCYSFFAGNFRAAHATDADVLSGAKQKVCTRFSHTAFELPSIYAPNEPGTYVLLGWLELSDSSPAPGTISLAENMAYIDVEVQESDVSQQQLPPLQKPRTWNCNGIDDWSQRSLRLGGLQRGSQNVLLDPGREDVEYFEVHFRVSPRIRKGSDGNGDTQWERRLPQPAAVVNLAKALAALPKEQRLRTEVVVYMNGFPAGGVYDAWRAWIEAAFEEHPPGGEAKSNQTYRIRFDDSCPKGNSNSFHYMVDRATQRRYDTAVVDDNNAILLLLEDDVMLMESALVELLSLFRTHNPCFATPLDFAERYTHSDYNPNDGQLTLIAALRRHWRDKGSLTCTYLARKETVRKAIREENLPIPTDDYNASMRLQAAGATIVSPIPGIASQIENVERYDEQTIGFYTDWHDIAWEALEAGEFIAAASGLPWPLPCDW